MQPKLELLENIRLKVSSTAPNDKEMCVMEAVAYFAGEPWSDRPKCASATITSFCISLNDFGTDQDRARLKDYVPRLIGTKDGYATEDKLGQMVIDWNFRTAIPALMRFADLESEAKKLEALKPVTRKTFEKAREQMEASWAASRAASWAASRAASRAASKAASWAASRAASEAASWAASWAASRAASRAASKAASRAASEAASRAASWAASEAASWAASWAASRAASNEVKKRFEKIRPALIDSMFELLDRMIAVAKSHKEVA